MTIDALAPTKERRRRSLAWDKPEKNRSTNRLAWRELDVFARMLKAREIELEHAKAAERFEFHYRFYLGHDARLVDEPCKRSGRMPEDPRIKHGQEIAFLRRNLTPRSFSALVLLTTEADTLEAVGRALCGARNTPQAIAAGRALVQEALAALALLWGYATSHPPNPR
jgi:hypothetical protein